MSTSSQQPISQIDLYNDSLTAIGATGSDTYTITLPDINVVNNSDMFTTSTMYTGGAGGTYTISNGGMVNDTITITSGSDFTFHLPEEWKDSFPDWDRVQDMCKQYPGLEIAFRNFRTIYELVKDDYDNPVPKK
jgi:hypothetical protein